MTNLWRTALLVLIRPAHCQPHPSSLSSKRHLSSSCCNAATSSEVTSHSSGVTRVYEDDEVPIRAEDLPVPVWKTMQELRAAGHAVMLVGGAVRDLLLGCKPKDYDLLTSAHIAEVKQLLPRPRVFGRTFPICQLNVNGVRMEISSMHTLPPVRLQAAGSVGCRAIVPPDAAQVLLRGPKEAVVAAVAAAKAAGAQIGRHRHTKAAMAHRQQQPQQWSALTPQHQQQLLLQQQQQRQRPPTWAAARRENALGRDFTANCLLYDPFAGLLFDYVGGVTDLQARVLRCNGDAAERFSRDPACMLRAVRCAARAGLQIEPQTLAALQQQGHLASSFNSQRLTAELLALLGYGAAAPSLQLLQQTQLLQHVLPLHAAYMQLVDQQQQGCSQQLSSSSCTPARLSGSSRPVHAAQCQHDSNGRGQGIAAAGQQQLKQAAALQHQAASALGQLWLGQSASSSPQHADACTRQSQRQPAQELQRQHQQLQHTNLLLQVLAALDQRVSVSHPAPAEVVVACLTAPLLVEALAAAVTLLQEHVVQNHKQSQQQLPALQHVQQQPLLPKQQEQDLATEALHLRQDQIAAAQAYSQPAAEMLTLVLQPLPAARNVARHFSSSSTASDGGELCMAQHSDLAWSPGQEVVQQLLQGMSPAGLIQQQGMHIASQVCMQLANTQPAQDQHTCHTANSSQLFGANAPKLAAEALLSHLQLSQQQEAQQRQGQRSATAAGAIPQQPQRRTGKSARKSSRQLHMQSAAVGDLWDEYAAALPRSNKQFRQLMQRQWDQQLPPNLEAGYVGTLATDAMLGAALGPQQVARGWLGSVNGLSSCSEEEEDGGDAEPAGQLLLHKVLQAAAVDLLGFEQQLCQLQQQCCKMYIR